MIPRRGLLAGLGALLAAPAIIRTPGLLMPVKPPLLVGTDWALGRDVSAIAEFCRRAVAEQERLFAEMQRRRLAHVRFLEGAQWDDSTTLRIGGKG